MYKASFVFLKIDVGTGWRGFFFQSTFNKIKNRTNETHFNPLPYQYHFIIMPCHLVNRSTNQFW
jgi:hypothetical protein